MTLLESKSLYSLGLADTDIPEIEKVLETLNRKGAMSPTSLSAQLRIPYSRLYLLLEEMSRHHLTLVRQASNTLDGQIVILGADAFSWLPA